MLIYNMYVIRFSNTCYVHHIVPLYLCCGHDYTFYCLWIINIILVKIMGSVCVGDTLSCVGCVKRKSLDPCSPLGNQCGYLFCSHVAPIGNARCVRLQGGQGI
jgi:hypothetical protein